MKSVFLGGGISGCADWQAVVSRTLLEAMADVVILNPRRMSFDLTDPTMTQQQILWEWQYLRDATIRLFWFAPETMCPITLFEYGKWLGKGGWMVVGTDPNYVRREDILIQTNLENPHMKVHNSLDDLTNALLELLGSPECTPHGSET
jgi:hypothetical protein